MKKAFAGNERLIELMAACGIAQEPLLIVGEPGTGKTLSAVRFLEGIGLRRGEPLGFYEKCFNPYIEPSEVYGPLDFALLTGGETKKGSSEYRRLTAGYLPSARAAFLDDLFAASPDFLLTFLSILEYRVYHNGPAVEPSPLSIIVVASNDVPRHQRLRALVSRLPIRVVAEDIGGVDSRANVLAKSYRLWGDRMKARQERPTKQGGETAEARVGGNGESACTFQDFEICSQALCHNEHDDLKDVPLVKKYVQCLDALARHSGQIATPNARTQQKAFVVMRALALLRRDNPRPEEEEIRILEHIFNFPEDRQAIRDELNGQNIPDWQYLS